MSEFLPYAGFEILRGEAYLVDKSASEPKPGRGIVLGTSGGLGKDLSHSDVRDMAIEISRRSGVAFVTRDYDHLANVLKAKEVREHDSTPEADVVFLSESADPNNSLV